jgi:hypothetical protein
MRPVHQAALCIPNILAEKADLIALFQILNPIGKLYVVFDQDCLTRRKANYESLVRAAGPVVGKNSRDNSFTLDEDVSLMLSEGLLNCGTISRSSRPLHWLASGEKTKEH